MSAEHFRKERLRFAVRTAALMGPSWGLLMYLVNWGDVNGPALAMASALFGLLMGAVVYWKIGRRVAEGRTDELMLSQSRTFAVLATPSEVFERIHAWLVASADHTVLEATAEFGTLRAKRHGSALQLGEEVAIHLVEQGGGTALRVVSHTISPIQQLDIGNNKRNVDEVATLVVDLFEVDVAPTASAQTDDSRIPQRSAASEAG